jgi:hypothetical protein
MTTNSEVGAAWWTLSFRQRRFGCLEPAVLEEEKAIAAE